jgi:hypothetical protein
MCIPNCRAVGAAGATGRTWLQHATSRAHAPSCYMAHPVLRCGDNGIFCWPGDCADNTQVDFTFPCRVLTIWVTVLRCGAVGSGTALQAGRSQVRFSMGPFRFFIDLFLPDALWPWVLFRL